MSKFGLYLCLVIVSGMLSEIKAQQNPHNGPAPAFDEWRKNNLQEKLYMHTDKDQYMPGEIAWFKIYYVDGSFHKPLQLSQVAYIELTDQFNKPVLQTSVSLKNTDGSGSLLIPADLNTGYYKLRCYTQWMKNFDAHFYFEKLLGIINIEQSSGDSLLPVKDIYDAGFFPEGGNLVNGIESKIAFHITNQYGKGIECTGVILDGGKDTVTLFQTADKGMGNFKLTPAPGHTYMARMLLPDGKTAEKLLPPSFDNGITMQVSPAADEKLGISVYSNDQSTAAVYVFAHTRGEVKIATLVSLVNGKGMIVMDKNKLGEGITQFTVFKNNQPVCERLYFIFPRKQFKINVSADSAEYGIRRKIKLHIGASDKGSPVASKVSVAIYRLDSLQDIDDMNIQNYLLLTSDIKGYIESPSWYFKENEPGREEAMDNLMLTQGWRRFDWNSILQQQRPTWKFAPEFNGELITARVTGRQTGLPLKGATVYLSVPGTDTRFWSSVTDADGIAVFETKNLFGNQEFIFRSPDNNAVIQFISPFSTEFSGYHPVPSFNPGKNHTGLLNKRSIYLQVQNVYNENKLNNFNIHTNENIPFYLKPDAKYILNRYTRFSTMEEVFREYIREVNVSSYRGSFHLQVYNAVDNGHFQTDPLVLLDGVAMPDMNKFMSYDPLKIRSIDVVTRKYFLGNMGYYGIVDCKTYKGDMNGYELDAGSVAVDYDALQQQREFYSPLYETPQEYSDRLPDFRTLLYWNPSFKTGNTGNENIQFYSSDIAGRYVVIVQGISEQGDPAVTSLYFNVKK